MAYKDLQSLGTLNRLQQRYGTDDGGIGRLGTNRLNTQPGFSVGGRRVRDGGHSQPDGMTDAEAEAAASVGNAMHAGEVGGAVMGLSGSPMAGVAGLATQGLTNAMANTLGPYGVTGLPANPQVGTPAFSQATPADDVAEGYTDAGAQAAAMSSLPGPVATGMGTYGNQVPDLGLGGLPSFGQMAGAFNTAIGDPFGLNAEDEAASMFAEAMGEVASGQFGGGRGGGGRGSNTGLGGMGGGVGDVGAGNPGGTGVL